MCNSFSAVISNLISLSELHDYWLHKIISQAGQLVGVNGWTPSSGLAISLHTKPESYQEKKTKTIGVLYPPFWRRAIQKRPLKIFIPPLRGKSKFPGDILCRPLWWSKYLCLHFNFYRFSFHCLTNWTIEKHQYIIGLQLIGCYRAFLESSLIIIDWFRLFSTVILKYGTTILAFRLQQQFEGGGNSFTWTLTGDNGPGNFKCY